MMCIIMRLRGGVGGEHDMERKENLTAKMKYRNQRNTNERESIRLVMGGSKNGKQKKGDTKMRGMGNSNIHIINMMQSQTRNTTNEANKKTDQNFEQMHQKKNRSTKNKKTKRKDNNMNNAIDHNQKTEEDTVVRK